MSAKDLRRELILSLKDVYQLEAFGSLEDLLQGESVVLQYLALHREEVVYPSDLSRELRLSRSRITSTLTSLRRKGCVEMQHSQDDRRRIRVTITRDGLALIFEKLAGMDRYFDQMIAGLGSEETKELIRLIRHCVEVMTE